MIQQLEGCARAGAFESKLSLATYYYHHPLRVGATHLQMSKTLSSTASSSNFKVIFEAAIDTYKRKTKQDIIAHPLATQLRACDSPAAIRNLLRDQVDKFNQFRGNGDERLQKWLIPTINVLYAFSVPLGEGIGLVSANQSYRLALTPI